MGVKPPEAHADADDRAARRAAERRRRDLRPPRGAGLRRPPRHGDARPDRLARSPRSRRTSGSARARARRSVCSRAGRALALLRGRRFLVPQDVADVAPEVLRHRLILTYDALAEGVTDRRRRQPGADDDADAAGDAPAGERPSGHGVSHERRRGRPATPKVSRPSPARRPSCGGSSCSCTRRLDGMLRGEFLGRQSGPGSEVAGARRYEAGDDSRWIDWNLTARSITPQVRTTEADRELQTWTVVDRSASMNFGTGEREKSEVAFAAAAAFGFLTARHGNRFGLLVAGGDDVVRVSARPRPVRNCSRRCRELYDVPRRTQRVGPTTPTSRPTLASLERARHRARPGHRGLRLPRRHRLATVRRPARARAPGAVRAGRRSARARAARRGHAHARRHRDRVATSTCSRTRPRCAIATPRPRKARHESIGRKIRDAGSEHLVLFTTPTG